MIRDDRELVENEVVDGLLGWELGDQKIWGGILEGIRLWRFSPIVWFEIGGFLCEGRTVAELVLFGC